MKFNYYHYILFFIIIVFIFIKIIVPQFISKEGFQEGLGIGDVGKEMRKTFERPFKKLGDDIKKPFEKFGNDVAGKFTDIFKKLTEFGKRFKGIGDGLKNIFEGIGDQFKYLGLGVARGFEDIGLLIAYATQFVFSYVICGVKYISNLPNCILYYLIDAFIQILYLPIRIVLWFLYSFLRINLYRTEAQIWDLVKWVDRKIYTSVGFNVLRWPKNIRDQCYNCKRLKTKTVLNKAKEIDYTFKVEIPRMIKKGTDRIKKGGDQIKRAFGV